MSKGMRPGGKNLGITDFILKKQEKVTRKTLTW